MSLWKFSLALYDQTGVEEHCVSLQDRFGVNINVFLLCIYAGFECGVTLSRDDIARMDDAVGQWHTQVVKRLREIRRFLKPQAACATPSAGTADSAQSMRTRIKSMELEAEQIETTLLQEWFEAWLPDRARRAPRAAVTANVQCVLSHYGAVGCTEASRSLIEVALRGLGGAPITQSSDSSPAS